MLRDWFRKPAGRLAAAALLAASAAHAMPRGVESVDAARWQALVASLDAPAVVVFTTKDCAYCPGVIHELANDIRRRKLPTSLIAVVMDVAPGEDDAALMSQPHYRATDRLMAVSGQAAAMRHAVNPKWRGVVPYVAFLKPAAPPVWVMGRPSDRDVAAWAATALQP